MKDSEFNKNLPPLNGATLPFNELIEREIKSKRTVDKFAFEEREKIIIDIFDNWFIGTQMTQIAYDKI